MAELESGWDNALFRVGDRLLARLPRRQAAAPLLEQELAWLSRLPELPVPIPRPVRAGEPAHGYPWRWSVVPWIEGEATDVAPLRDDQAPALVAFLKALHVEAPADAPVNPFRAVPLSERREGIEARMATVDLPPRARQALRDGFAAPPATERRWVHGDLHPRNVLSRDGALAAVIDWGDLSGGDVATDLAALWLLVDDERARDRALADYGADEATVVRARGWAAAFGVLLVTIADDERHQASGCATLARL